MSQYGKSKLMTVALALAVVTIPLKNNWNSWALVAFCCIAFMQDAPRTFLRRAWEDPYWKISAAFFLWMSLTWFWDITGDFPFRYLEPSAIFLFLPFVLAGTARVRSRQLYLACHLFVATIVVVCLICLIKSALAYHATGDYRVFFYHYLGFQLGLNAIYLSNYCISSLLFLAYFRFYYRGEHPFRIPAGVAIGTTFFLVGMMFLLSAKMPLALLVLLGVFLLLHTGYKRKKLLPALLILLAFGGVTVYLANNLHYLNWRIKSTSWKSYAGPEDNNNGLALRLTTWQSALELIAERPLQGYGMRGANEAIVQRYHAKNFQMGIPERYNSHNQFMETTLKAGLPGLAFLVALLAIPFFSAIRRKKFLLAMMVLHFCLVSQVEATMEVQQELTFYWFFIFLFHYHYFNRNTANA